MSVTATSSTSTSTALPLTHTSATTQTQTGLSSVSDTMSSAAPSSAGYSFWSCICSPFNAIGKFFANAFNGIKNFFASFFPETDKHRMGFIRENLNALTGEVLIEAQDKFSHIHNVKLRVEAFKMIQNSPDVSNETALAFYNLLPVDTQNHLERHIWIENGRNDNGQVQFGKNVINSDIRAPIVAQAIDKCIAESV